MHLLGRVNLKRKDSVLLTRAPKMGALSIGGNPVRKLKLCCALQGMPVERHRHTFKSINSHYLFVIFGVVFLNICCHVLAMIL